MTNYIESIEGGGIIAVGPVATKIFSLTALMGALKLEALGMRRRGRSALSIAKQTTGLRSNDKHLQLAKLEEMRDALRLQLEA
jgi:hypothetical protein